MTRCFVILFFLIFAFSFSCNVTHDEDEMYVPTDVLVKTDSTYSIAEVFNFINSFDFKVEDISSSLFYSTLPFDSIEYVKEYLTELEYYGTSQNSIEAYVHYRFNEILVSVSLRDMHKIGNQISWLNAIEDLQLHEKPRYLIHFNVPKGQERQWEKRFEEYGFVEWAELNYYIEVTY
ncbi:MAG: hypothetical protein C0596_13950 [Marinilabiliales bacterium]|nr:MAG: hypothetical protein C0596_13950 [Marinilabiliales bacterium]